MAELTDEEVFGPGGVQKEMTDEEVFGRSLQPPTAGEAIPEAFLDRVRAGQALGRIFQEGAKSAGEGFGTPTPTGFEDETLGHLIDTGIFHDPLKGRASPVQFATEALMMPAAKAWDAITRSVNAGIHGAGGAMGQLVEEFGGSQGTANRAKNEVINAGNWAMIEGGMGRFSRPAATPEGVMDQTIGGLPKPEDFSNAAQVLGGKPNPPPFETTVEINGKARTQGSYVAYHGTHEVFDEFSPAHQGTGAAAPFTSGKGYFFSADPEMASGYAEGTAGAGNVKRARIDLDNAERLTFEQHKISDLAEGDEAISGMIDKARADGRDGLVLKDVAGKPGNDVIVAFDHDSIKDEAYGSHVEENLRRMWQEDGIHPAEAVHDAQTDAFVKNEIVAPREEIKLDPETEAILTETGGKPGSLSAAITPPEEIPIDVQPASPPGRLAAAFKDAADTLMDIGRDAQMLTAPMATGTRDSMAIAKDFANTMRRNRWDWDRIDSDVVKKFTPEQRARMWSAADEESTSLQLKEPAHMREHQGFATLEPAERAAVEELQTRAQSAWVRARDIGMVEGEGLPAYTPRMVMNVGTAFADDKALPLNSIGNNLKIRTAQMLRRKHMTVEETEKAAKDYVGMRAALKGKSVEEINAAIDKVAVARDIRVLPMATAKLEDAIAGRTLINNIKKYGDSTGAETVVEGAIPAGSDTKWFTLDHPAFRTWRPKLAEVEGKFQAVKDTEGNTIFEQVPLYVHGDFEGPLRAVLSQKSGAIYGGMMAVKAKTMSLIMNSPMIHNAVEFGRAFPAMPVRIFKAYFDGNRAKNNVPLMHEAIDNGLVPIGHRFFNQDISGLMESPDLTPGRSWTAQILAAVPGLFDEAAGTAVKVAIDKAGDFWHNTLLWDRVADLQMGLYVNMRGDMIAKGIDAQTASRIAAHWANRYAGALPKEAMSDAATKFSNFALFSRSFTLGNLGVLKDVFTGLPKDVLAQIERDAGVIDPAAKGYAKDMARRKAFSIVMMDIALLHVANSVLQSALSMMLMDKSMSEEMHGYTRRYRDMVNETETHPLSLITPLSLAGGAMGGAVGGVGGAMVGAALGTGLGVMRRMSATFDNEHGKQDRLKIGYGADGTAIYARSPFGKIGEEFTGYLESPIDMLKKKEGTLARPMLQVVSNDKGFGRKIYDPDAETLSERAFAMWQIIKHIGKSQFPEGQINAFADTVKGEGDKKVNLLQLAGPMAGVTFSRGAPGGPAVGEMYHAKSQFEFQVNQAMPDIRRQILRGDQPGAEQAMKDLGMDAAYSRWVVKTTLNPATRLSPKGLRDFYRTATPEQRDRMVRAQQAPPPQ
jgi:ADP-ribosyltransferase-like protein